MSNLNLGNVSFAGLKARIKPNGPKKIGYATTAIHYGQDGSTDEYIAIVHHNSVIAEVAENWVYVTNAGYGSSTTRSRINAVLSGNDVPLYVSQRNFAQCLFDADTHEQYPNDFRSVTWDHTISDITGF